jgi:glucosylglycerol 3-phosphatase
MNNQLSLSLDREALIQLLVDRENILLVQDLDGVCMGLVKDPLTREIDRAYLEATRCFDGHFYVLTNGEHIGKRGVNSIVERAFGDASLVKKQGFYLPGLAAGGVQWQDRYGNVTHPGVSQAELDFLAEVPEKITQSLQAFFQNDRCGLDNITVDRAIAAAVLDNLVSPTANLNVFYELLGGRTDFYALLQQSMASCMDGLLEEASAKGLDKSFFVHYAPNLGRNESGKEIFQPAVGKDSGTTDFQFMLAGAIKEAGIVAILNHYYEHRTGNYPLGKEFNIRQAPHRQSELLEIVINNFDPALMPTIIGVGDTVTSKAQMENGSLQFRRGGSDRGFLELIQALGRQFNTENTIVYVDSSGGEVKNRQPLKLETFIDDTIEPPQKKLRVVNGPGDERDNEDPLTLNIVFPEGHQQYINCFQEAARRRKV